MQCWLASSNPTSYKFSTTLEKKRQGNKAGGVGSKKKKREGNEAGGVGSKEITRSDLSLINTTFGR